MKRALGKLEASADLEGIIAPIPRSRLAINVTVQVIDRPP